MKKLILFCITIGWSASTWAGLLFHYSQLALKDLDQMNKMVQSKIRESQKTGGNKVIPLKEALQAVFARSNEDFMIEKIMPPLKIALDERDAWEPTIRSLVKEAVGALKNPKAFKPVVQVTYIVFLENLIAELKPRLSEEFENKMITQIRDAKISVTKEAANERRLRVMKETTSPSLIAEAVLREHEEMKKAAPPAPVETPAPAQAPAAEEKDQQEDQEEQDSVDDLD